MLNTITFMPLKIGLGLILLCNKLRDRNENMMVVSFCIRKYSWYFISVANEKYMYPNMQFSIVITERVKDYRPIQNVQKVHIVANAWISKIFASKIIFNSNFTKFLMSTRKKGKTAEYWNHRHMCTCIYDQIDPNKWKKVLHLWWVEKRSIFSWRKCFTFTEKINQV